MQRSRNVRGQAGLLGAGNWCFSEIGVRISGLRTGDQMSLKFCPTRGEVLMCDFGIGGFKAPEMVKTRPCIVVSRAGASGLSTIVPLSGTVPSRIEDWHYLIPSGNLPGIWNEREMWAKCDVVSTVGWFRLQRLRHRKQGEWCHAATRIGTSHMAKIEDCLRAWLALNKTGD